MVIAKPIARSSTKSVQHFTLLRARITDAHELDDIFLLHSAKYLNRRIYNLGSGVATSNENIKRAVIHSIPNAEIALNPGRSRPYRPDAYMNLDRIRADVGYH